MSVQNKRLLPNVCHSVVAAYLPSLLFYLNATRFLIGLLYICVMHVYLTMLNPSCLMCETDNLTVQFNHQVTEPNPLTKLSCLT